MARRLAPEDDQIEQRVRPEAVRTVNRYAGGLAHGHQPRDHGVAAVAPGQDLAMHVARDPAHVVVHGGQHRNGVAVDVDVGEDSGGFGDPGEPLLDDRRPQMLEMQMNVILALARRRGPRESRWSWSG